MNFLLKYNETTKLNVEVHKLGKEYFFSTQVFILYHTEFLKKSSLKMFFPVEKSKVKGLKNLISTDLYHYIEEYNNFIVNSEKIIDFLTINDRKIPDIKFIDDFFETTFYSIDFLNLVRPVYIKDKLSKLCYSSKNSFHYFMIYHFSNLYYFEKFYNQTFCLLDSTIRHCSFFDFIYLLNKKHNINKEKSILVLPKSDVPIYNFLMSIDNECLSTKTILNNFLKNYKVYDQHFFMFLHLRNISDIALDAMFEHVKLKYIQELIVHHGPGKFIDQFNIHFFVNTYVKLNLGQYISTQKNSIKLLSITLVVFFCFIKDEVNHDNYNLLYPVLEQLFSYFLNQDLNLILENKELHVLLSNELFSIPFDKAFLSVKLENF